MNRTLVTLQKVSHVRSRAARRAPILFSLMKSSLIRSFSRALAALLIPAMLSVSPAQAAGFIRWSELGQRIRQDETKSSDSEDHLYRVKTKDGKTYTGHTFRFSPANVQVDPAGPTIPREQVTEVDVRRTKSLWDTVVAPAGAVVGGAICPTSDGYCFPSAPVVIVLLPAAVAITAAAAPFTLPIYGIRKLLPGKKYKIAP